MKKLFLFVFILFVTNVIFGQQGLRTTINYLKKENSAVFQKVDILKNTLNESKPPSGTFTKAFEIDSQFMSIFMVIAMQKFSKGDEGFMKFFSSQEIDSILRLLVEMHYHYKALLVDVTLNGSFLSDHGYFILIEKYKQSCNKIFL